MAFLAWRMLGCCLLLAAVTPRVSAIKVPPTTVCVFTAAQRLADASESSLATGVLSGSPTRCGRGPHAFPAAAWPSHPKGTVLELSGSSTRRALRCFVGNGSLSLRLRESRGRQGQTCKTCVLRPGTGLQGRVRVDCPTRSVCPVPRSRRAVAHLQYPLLFVAPGEGTQRSALASPPPSPPITSPLAPHRLFRDP